MVKSNCLITFLSLFFSQLPFAEANEENLKLVTSTGRAAILSDEQLQETRSRALEDALYSALAVQKLKALVRFRLAVSSMIILWSGHQVKLLIMIF